MREEQKAQRNELSEIVIDNGGASRQLHRASVILIFNGIA